MQGKCLLWARHSVSWRALNSLPLPHTDLFERNREPDFRVRESRLRELNDLLTQGLKVVRMGLKPILPSGPWCAVTRGDSTGPGLAGAYLCAPATVHIGAHGVVGTGPAHVQVCPVPGLDESDEVPTLSLWPDRKLCRCPNTRPCPSLSEATASPSVDPVALTLPSLPDNMHSSMRCGEAAQWICQRWRLEKAACWPGP